MQHIKTEITINNSIEKVWEMLMNHSKYPSWNPFIKSIKGEVQVGRQITVKLQNNNEKPMTFKPEVLVVKKNHEFRWKGHLFVKGLFDGEHYFQLKKIDENKTLFIHGENFSGILSNVILKLIKEKTTTSFRAMNESLKNILEY